LLATRRATGVGRRVHFETVFAARRSAVDERAVGLVALARTTVVADWSARLAVRTQVFGARCRAAVDHCLLRVAAHRTAFTFGRVQVRGVIALWARTQHGAAVWFRRLHRRFARAAVVADLTTRFAVWADVLRARLARTIVRFRAAHRAALAFRRVDVRVGRALWQRTAHGGALVVIRVVARAAVVADLTARFAVRAQVLRAKNCVAVDFLLARWAAVSWFGHNRVAFFAHWFRTANIGAVWFLFLARWTAVSWFGHNRVAFFAHWFRAENIGARVGFALALPLWARRREALFRRVDAFLAWFALDIARRFDVVVARTTSVADLTTRFAVRAQVLGARRSAAVWLARRAAVARQCGRLESLLAQWRSTAHVVARVRLFLLARWAALARHSHQLVAFCAQRLRAANIVAVWFLFLARWAAVAWLSDCGVAFFAQWLRAANVGAWVGLALALPLRARGGEALFRRVDAFLAWFALDVTLANAVVVADVFATVAHTRGVAAVRVAHFGAVAFVRARTIGRRLHCWARQVGTRLYTVVFARTSCTAVEIRVTAFL